MLLATSILSMMAQEEIPPEAIIPIIIASIGILILSIFLFIIPMWKIFTKAGKPGWASLIPIYNIYVMTEIVGRPAWWVLLIFVLSFIPFLNIGALIALIILYVDMARSFAKSDLFGVGLALLSPIFVPILGYGSSQYIGPSVVQKAEKAI